MRRQADLDSNNCVVLRPYCNGRATGFNKVLTRSKTALCADEQKTAPRRKASVVGFRCPDCGTVPKLQIPSSKLQRNIKLQAPKQRRTRLGVWLFGASLELGALNLEL
jgi:hypothetical protein